MSVHIPVIDTCPETDYLAEKRLALPREYGRPLGHAATLLRRV